MKIVVEPAARIELGGGGPLGVVGTPPGVGILKGAFPPTGGLITVNRGHLNPRRTVCRRRTRPWLFHFDPSAFLTASSPRRERQLEGIAKAKTAGVYKGRPASIDAAEVRELKAKGMGASEIAKHLKIGRASVYRVLESAS